VQHCVALATTSHPCCSLPFARMAASWKSSSLAKLLVERHGYQRTSSRASGRQRPRWLERAMPKRRLDEARVLAAVAANDPLQSQPIIWTMMSGTRRRTSGWSSGAAACSSTAFFSTDAPCSAVLRWWLLRGNAVRGKQGPQRSNMLGALPTRWRARGDGKCCAPNPSTVVQTPRQR